MCVIYFRLDSAKQNTLVEYRVFVMWVRVRILPNNHLNMLSTFTKFSK